MHARRRFTRAELEWIEKLALAEPVQGCVVPLPERNWYLVLSGTLTIGPERAGTRAKTTLAPPVARRCWRVACSGVVLVV